jgi:hypothetical protein
MMMTMIMEASQLTQLCGKTEEIESEVYRKSITASVGLYTE